MWGKATLSILLPIVSGKQVFKIGLCRYSYESILQPCACVNVMCLTTTEKEVDDGSPDCRIVIVTEKQKNPSFQNRPDEQVLTDLDLLKSGKLNYIAGNKGVKFT